MAANKVIDLDDDQSDLTTAVSGDTPTLPGEESPTIQGLLTAKDDASYDLLCAQIPSANRVKIRSVTYVKYDPYRIKKSKRSAWYWGDQGEELIRVTKGKHSYLNSLLIY